jgi:predicted  nucleic acid-binding Zn-ribbon protein
MERIEMLSDIELRIKDIDQRRDELKTWMDNHPDHPQYDEAEKLLFEMNKILDSLRMKFKDLEANISGDQKNVTVMEQNIYSNIRAFDSAFTKAGSIFRGTRRT